MINNQQVSYKEIYSNEWEIKVKTSIFMTIYWGSNRDHN